MYADLLVIIFTIGFVIIFCKPYGKKRNETNYDCDYIEYVFVVVVELCWRVSTITICVGLDFRIPWIMVLLVTCTIKPFALLVSGNNITNVNRKGSKSGTNDPWKCIL